LDGAAGEAGKPRPTHHVSGKAKALALEPDAPDEATPLLLTPKQTADVLAVGRTTVYGLLTEGKLPSVQIGSCRRIPYAAVRSYVEALRQAKDASGSKLQTSKPRSQASTRMKSKGAPRRPTRPAGLLIEALRLPFAAGDQATDQAQVAPPKER
jgi:excisionase family DNA binding protein